MSSLSRGRWRAPAVAAVALLTLSGCGSSAAPKDAAGSPSASPAGSPSTSPAASPSATAEDDPTEDRSETAGAGAQVVDVEKYGVSFELPKGWMTLDAKKALSGGGKNPFLKDLAGRLGTTPEQLVQSFSTYVQTFSVSDQGATHGFLSNVNSVGQEGDVNDEQIKLQLATLGAKPGELTHATTEAGDLTRVPYQLASNGVTVQAVALALHAEGATVVITVSASSTQEAGRLADQVQKSLRKIPGTGPNA
jgi:hypothetical protein